MALTTPFIKMYYEKVRKKKFSCGAPNRLINFVRTEGITNITWFLRMNALVGAKIFMDKYLLWRCTEDVDLDERPIMN